MTIDRRSLLAAPLAAALASPAAAQGGRTIDIRIGAGHPPAALWISTLRDSFMPNVVARVQRETPHRIRFTEGFGGSVCRPGDCLEAVETGLLDIAEIQVIFEPAKLMAHNFTIYVPFGPPDAKFAASCVRETYRRVPRLAEILERNYRQVYLAASVVGNYGIVTNFTWNDLTELRGRKIAAAGPNIPWLQGQNVGRSAGAEQSERGLHRDADRRGTTAGSCSPTASPASACTSSSRQYGAHRFRRPGAIPVLTANVQSWRRLPPEVQRIIRDEAEKWSDHLGDVINQRAEESFDIMRRQGLVVRSLDDAQKRRLGECSAQHRARAHGRMRRNNQPAEAVEVYVRVATEGGHRFPRDWLNS